MINPWTQGRVHGVRMNPTLGAWQNRRKLASAAWVPPQWVRLSLAGAHMFWYSFPQLVLAAGETQLTRVTISEDFWMLSIMSHETVTIAGTGSIADGACPSAWAPGSVGGGTGQLVPGSPTTGLSESRGP